MANTLMDDPLSIIQAVTACGVVVLDVTDEDVVAANQTAAEILGRPLSRPLGHTTPRDRPALIRSDGTALPWEERPSALAIRTGQAQRNVLVGVAFSDGWRRNLRVDAVPVGREDGVVSWVVISFVDMAWLS